MFFFLYRVERGKIPYNHTLHLPSKALPFSPGWTTTQRGKRTRGCFCINSQRFLPQEKQWISCITKRGNQTCARRRWNSEEGPVLGGWGSRISATIMEVEEMRTPMAEDSDSPWEFPSGSDWGTAKTDIPMISLLFSVLYCPQWFGKTVLNSRVLWSRMIWRTKERKKKCVYIHIECMKDTRRWRIQAFFNSKWMDTYLNLNYLWKEAKPHKAREFGNPPGNWPLGDMGWNYVIITIYMLIHKQINALVIGNVMFHFSLIIGQNKNKSCK